MKLRSLQVVGLASVMALAACAGQSNSALPSTASAPVGGVPESNVIASCGNLAAGDEVTCFALQRTDIGDAAAFYFPGRVSLQSTSVSGYGPSDLQSAYKLATSGGSGQTVAIVDAYNDPNAENDLGVYRAHYGLSACTTANGCFRKLNQNGAAGSYPRSNAGWGQEISLDLDMVSAICPNCHIMLVEAKTATNANLGTAVNTAVAKSANVVSNSYGGSETGSSNSAYSHAGHVIVASAGDSGTGASQPCSYGTVVCVGGTALNRAGNSRGWSETVWSGSGSGCSALVSKPSWQTDSGCSKRSEADVSAVADPNTGVAVYDSYGSRGQTGWLVFGGTSVASPLIGAVYALAGNASSQNAAQGIWNNAGRNLFDVTSGSNGSCSISYICNAGVGYDGPTGWGTPNGATAF
ncbi:MAG: peptidase S8 [Candidatus Eremiobacteraeota bacterium]|nr:peptidase S8 [Candidatus Eremiobacteraeota bacterium]